MERENLLRFCETRPEKRQGWSVLTNRGHRQQEMEYVNLEEMVPKDHLLRKIDRHVDFEFIREKCRPLYCEDNGRPSLDPVMLFKMLLLGYLYGIRSERRLVQEIEVNLAYRWFLGMSLREEAPHHSTFSQNRIRRFNGTPLVEEIFGEIVGQAMKKGLLEGRQLFTDSTLLKANANRKRFEERRVEQVKQEAREYLEDLDREVEEDRHLHGKKPLKEKQEEAQGDNRAVKVSLTDPESGYVYREGKPEGFYYSSHVTVDGKHNLVTDVHVTAGNVSDGSCYLQRLDHQRKRFGFEVEEVALDAGYLNMPICRGLQERGIFGVIAHRRFHPRKGFIPKGKYVYDGRSDSFTCPEGQELTYRRTDREGYRHYVSDASVCGNCPLRVECTTSREMKKTLTRHIWESSREWVRMNRLMPRGKELYARRKETIERCFADAKELHGMRYARYRGRERVQEQCLLTATAQNIKKMALVLSRMGGGNPSQGNHLPFPSLKILLSRFLPSLFCLQEAW